MDFDLVDTEELLAELCKRFDLLVFAGIQEKNVERQDTRVAYSGDYLKCIGACYMAADEILETYVNSQREPDDGD